MGRAYHLNVRIEQKAHLSPDLAIRLILEVGPTDRHETGEVWT